jgi:hypothetical protein
MKRGNFSNVGSPEIWVIHSLVWDKVKNPFWSFTRPNSDYVLKSNMRNWLWEISTEFRMVCIWIPDVNYVSNPSISLPTSRPDFKTVANKVIDKPRKIPRLASDLFAEHLSFSNFQQMLANSRSVSRLVTIVTDKPEQVTEGVELWSVNLHSPIRR